MQDKVNLMPPDSGQSLLCDAVRGTNLSPAGKKTFVLNKYKKNYTNTKQILNKYETTLRQISNEYQTDIKTI